MTRERASGPGDGDPASGSSPPPSVYPEPPVGERGDRVPAAPDHYVPRWQEFADAVWLAAHRSRYARPGDEDRSSPAADVETERPRDAETEQPPPPDADDGALLDRPAPDEDASTETEPPPTGRIPGPVPAADRSASRAASHAAERFLPHPEGRFTLHLGPPLLPRAEPDPSGPGRVTALLARALHHLARRIPSRSSLELDEETTAEQGLVDGLWMPFLRPARVSAFDLVLLLDDAPTMRIWEESAARLARAAEHSGAFRSVRTIRATVPRTGTATLRWPTGRAVADPAELLDGRGSRIFLVVTDGLAHGWAATAADELLGRLAHAGPTALVHLLAPHLRHRSSLYPYPAVLEAGGFGASNDGLGHWAPPGGPDPMRPLPEAGDDSVAVPVLSLKPASLAAWSDLVTGGRGVRRSLPVVLAGALSKGAPAPGLRAPRLPRAASAAVRRFFSLATPSARRLATQLAAIPFDFDLVEQLRRRVMPETGPDHLAEILMGGLIDWEGGGRGRPEFAEGVREALLATTTRSQLARTVSVVG
ncbi:SAV_2336 N-terminal domain-related protein, partial [Streptomyces sp. NRRL S-146]|uniref:SAV_2336 N-terminal domain-related protein n=1 Tax=Streptomyces sp. NRRL S-146 TaxID=1463884 RepID=UPI00055B82B8